MARPFLTARWTNLCLFTYAAPRELLEPLLPDGLELDEHEGQAFVSLVAFDFEDTRVLGVPWPGYRAFPELNLRTYVRHGERRGVLFLREFVESRLICFVANRFYNEPYRAAPLRHDITTRDGEVEAVCELTLGGRTHRLAAACQDKPHLPPEGFLTHFLKEQQWGFGRDRRGRLTWFEVRHVAWEVLPVKSYEIDFSFAAVYGPEWGFLQEAEPASVVFALGSAVELYPNGRIVGQASSPSGNGLTDRLEACPMELR